MTDFEKAMIQSQWLIIQMNIHISEQNAHNAQGITTVISSLVQILANLAPDRTDKLMSQVKFIIENVEMEKKNWTAISEEINKIFNTFNSIPNSDGSQFPPFTFSDN